MQQRQSHCVQSRMLFNSFVKNRLNYFKSSPLFAAVELWYLINSRMIKTRTIQATLVHALSLNWQYQFFSMFNNIIIYLLTTQKLRWTYAMDVNFYILHYIYSFNLERVFGFWVTIPCVCDLGTFINMLIRYLSLVILFCIHSSHRHTKLVVPLSWRRAE